MHVDVGRGGNHLDPGPGQQLGQGRVGRQVHHLGPDLHQVPASRAPGQDSAAGSVSRLQDEHGTTGGQQRPGAGQAGHPGANHDDVNVGVQRGVEGGVGSGIFGTVGGPHTIEAIDQ